jgi:WD40 repeat protein
MHHLNSHFLLACTSFMMTSNLLQGQESVPTPLADSIAIRQIQLSTDGKKLLVAGGHSDKMKSDSTLLDLGAGKRVFNGVSRVWGVHAACISPDGKLIAVGGNGARFHLVDAATGQMVWNLTLAGHEGIINQIVFTPDSKRLISSDSVQKEIRFWNIGEKKQETAWFFSVNKVPSLGIRRKDLDDNSFAKIVLSDEYDGIGGFSLSPDGKTIALSQLSGGKIAIVEVATGKTLRVFESKSQRTYNCTFSSDGKWLFVAGSVAGFSPRRMCVDIWDLEKAENLKSMFCSCTGGFVVSPDKKTIITNSATEGFRIWDVATGQVKFAYFNDKESEHGCMAFLPDGKTFLLVPRWLPTDPAYLEDSRIHFYDTATGLEVDHRKRFAAP